MSKRRREATQAPWHSPPEAWEAIKLLARQMRREPTPAERMLWDRLRAHQVLGFRFRRQHALDRFIVDFYCSRARLIIELDGAAHETQREQDAWRDANLVGLGMRVLRFRNEEVLESLPDALRKIEEALNATPPPSPSPRAERGRQGNGRESGETRGEVPGRSTQ